MRCLTLAMLFGCYGSAALAASAAAPAPQPESEPVPDDATLQAAGARIGRIEVQMWQIFDTRDPAENNALYRTANRLHVRTRESVVRAQLLFATGDPYSERVLKETERNLRGLPFLREPTVRPIRYHDGVVDVEVVTHDVWTLQLGPTFGRSGGENSTSISFEDVNLFGFGKTLSVGLDHNVDRDAVSVEWRDPNVWGTHWRDILHWSDTSDGHVRQVSIWKPFYSLSTRHGYGLFAGDSQLVDRRYRLGDAYDSYAHDQRRVDVYGGWSKGLRNGYSQRLSLGWNLSRDQFRRELDTQAPLPADRKLSYPYLRADWVRDEFQTTRDLEQIQRTEDVQFGLSGTVIAGIATRGTGSDRNAVVFDVAGNYGLRITGQQQLFLTASLLSRLEDGRSVDRRASLVGAWYWRHNERLLSHAKLSVARGAQLDLDHYYLLGGDNGLRGYPLRYQMGTGLTLIKLEERLFTGYTLWRLFGVGAAAFFDAGRVEGGNPVGAPNLGWLRDVGVGLRLGNSRSSIGNVIHIDLATPLDRSGGDVRGLQWLVSTEVSF